MINQDLIRQLNILQKQVDNLVKPEVPSFSVTPFSGLNPIINGGMNVWQRGTSFAAVANGTVTADRFIYQKSGSMVHTVSQVTGSLTTSLPFNSYMLVDCTTADTSIAAGDYTNIVYPLEGYDWLPFALEGFWLTFWAYTPVQGTYCVSVQNSGSDRSCVVEFSGVVNTWGYHEVFFPASPTAGTWNYDTGVGLYIRWCLAAGSTYHTTADAWQTGNFYATANQVNAVSSATNNFQLANIKLSKKSTDFTSVSYQQELARCQRYYWQFDTAVYPVGVAFATSSTTTARALLPTPVEMRALPTIAGFGQLRGNGGSFTITGTTPISVEASGVTADFTVASGLVLNHIYVPIAASGVVTFSAEL